MNDTLQTTVDGSTRAKSYVIKNDTGFAPHITDEWLTIATCAPATRSASVEDDWIIAVGNADYPTDHELVYVAQVDEILPMSEYYTDNRFHQRKPLSSGPDNGDNIYAPRAVVENIETVSESGLPDDADATESYETGLVDGVACWAPEGEEYFQLEKGYHNLSNYETDLLKQGDRNQVLVCSTFYYFGENHITLPDEMAHKVAPGNSWGGSRNSGRRCTDSHDIAEFLEWIEEDYAPGINGAPKHASKDTCPPAQTPSTVCPPDC